LRLDPLASAWRRGRAHYSDRLLGDNESGDAGYVASVDLEGDDDVAFSTGLGPISIAFQPSGRSFLVSNYFESDLYAWDISNLEQSNLDVNAGPYRGAFTSNGDRFFVPCYASSQEILPGIVDVIAYNNGEPVVTRSLKAGVHPLAIAVANQRLEEAERFYGIKLYVSPSETKSPGNVYLDWMLIPPDGVDMRIDAVLAVVYESGIYYAFEAGFKNVRRVDPRDPNSIPILVKGMEINESGAGRIIFPITGAQKGGYRFIAALMDPKTKNALYMNTSKTFSIQ